MKLVIDRGASNGVTHYATYIDGVRHAPHDASRVLTDTTNETGPGVFTQCTEPRDVMFSRGARRITVQFGPLDTTTIGRADLQRVIKHRVERVRAQMSIADWKEIIPLQFDEVD